MSWISLIFLQFVVRQLIHSVSPELLTQLLFPVTPIGVIDWGISSSWNYQTLSYLRFDFICKPQRCRYSKPWWATFPVNSIFVLQTRCIDFCERHAWTFVEKARKRFINHLVAVVQPPALKSRVEDALRLEKCDVKEDFFSSAEFLADEAEVCEKYHPPHA